MRPEKHGYQNVIHPEFVIHPTISSHNISKEQQH